MVNIDILLVILKPYLWIATRKGHDNKHNLYSMNYIIQFVHTHTHIHMCVHLIHVHVHYS